MVVWNWEDHNPIEELFLPIYSKRSGQYLKDVRESIKLMSMFFFIVRNNFTSPEELRDSVKKDDKPILSIKDSEEIWKKTHKKLSGGAMPPREPGNELIINSVASTFSFLDILNLSGSIENFEKNLQNQLEEYKKKNKRAGILVEIASRGSQGAAEGLDGVATTFGGIVGQTLVAPMTILLATFSAALQVAKGDRGSAMKSFLDVTPGVDIIAGPLEQYNALIAKLTPEELEEFWTMFSLDGLPLGQKLVNLKNNLTRHHPRNMSGTTADVLENLANNLRRKFKYKTVDKDEYLQDFVEYMDKLVEEHPEFKKQLVDKLQPDEPVVEKGGKAFSGSKPRTLRNGRRKSKNVSS